MGSKPVGALLIAMLGVATAKANPQYDHVVVVVMENHGYSQIIGSPDAPYINNTLLSSAANITNAYGIEHPSQPNYYWLFSGSNQGITTDHAPTEPTYTAPNLYSSLSSAGLSFAGYAGSFPGTADRYETTLPNYAPRHLPWLGFQGIPADVTKSFENDFPTTSEGFSALPTVSFVIPGLNDDMHDYDSSGNEVSNPTESALAVSHGDAWLQANIDPYRQWAETHNSLLILTFDEDSTADWITPPLTEPNAEGMTAPNLGPNPTGNSGPNQITMLLAGAAITPGNYAEGAGVTNVNLLRTIESFYGLSPVGDQSPLATDAGISNQGITDVFDVPEPSAFQLEAVLGLVLIGGWATGSRRKVRRDG